MFPFIRREARGARGVNRLCGGASPDSMAVPPPQPPRMAFYLGETSVSSYNGEGSRFWSVKGRGKGVGPGTGELIFDIEYGVPRTGRLMSSSVFDEPTTGFEFSATYAYPENEMQTVVHIDVTPQTLLYRREERMPNQEHEKGKGKGKNVRFFEGQGHRLGVQQGVKGKGKRAKKFGKGKSKGKGKELVVSSDSDSTVVVEAADELAPFDPVAFTPPTLLTYCRWEH